MKDEIKEILDNVKKCCDITKDQSFTVYQRQDILVLLDYITYLQKENRRLSKEIKKNKKENDEIRNKNCFLVNGFHELEERIDKAIEILHQLNETLPADLVYSEIAHAEYILQGSDK